MGLTIHYSLRSAAHDVATARELVFKLRQKARDLPFQEVEEIVDLRGEECEHSHYGTDDSRSWLLIQASHHVHRDQRTYAVAPRRVVAFSTWPGPGCEAANFGLALYPASIETDDGPVRVGLRGWHWSSFCKTQYASDPSCGGTENFLRCHLAVVAVLDHAAALGMLGKVKDEGGFWQRRDVAALAREVGQWNQMLAAAVGKLKDQFGDQLRAPITGYPNFEHLEAAGAQQIKRRKRRDSR